MTIKDIARLSGYGVSTVSRVLNGHPDVSETARKRVMAVVEEYHFQPNNNAKHLKLQKSSSIAVIIKGTQNMLFADILERIQALLRGYGEEAVFCYLDEDANEVTYAIQLCRERQPRGILFLGGDLSFFQEYFHQITIPCVLLTNTAQELKFENLSSVTTDDCAASDQVVEYLISKGHSKIGVLGGNMSSTQISYRRIVGCQQAFQRHRIPFNVQKQCEPCRYSMQEGYDSTKRLLMRNPDLTAIFAISDVIAIGAMRALHDLGRSVPKDISLVGFDGIDLSQYCIPSLTTIHQNSEQLAKKGVEILMQRIHYSHASTHKEIPFELVERESVCQIS